LRLNSIPTIWTERMVSVWASHGNLSSAIWGIAGSLLGIVVWYDLREATWIHSTALADWLPCHLWSANCWTPYLFATYLMNTPDFSNWTLHAPTQLDPTLLPPYLSATHPANTPTFLNWALHIPPASLHKPVSSNRPLHIPPSCIHLFFSNWPLHNPTQLDPALLPPYLSAIHPANTPTFMNWPLHTLTHFLVPIGLPAKPGERESSEPVGTGQHPYLLTSGPYIIVIPTDSSFFLAFCFCWSLDWLISDPEDGSDIFLWNVSSYMDNMALYPRRLQFS
jgi:hypothetical protein